MANTPRTTTAHEGGAQPIKSTSSNPRRQPRERKVTLTLRASGEHVFSPILDRDRVYEVTVSGSWLYRHWWFESTGDFSDALYHTATHRTSGWYGPRFGLAHDWLCVNSTPLWNMVEDHSAQIVHQDKEIHLYTFHIDGTGEKIALTFDYPYEEQLPQPPLTVTLIRLDADVALLASREKPEKVSAEEAALKDRLEFLRLQAHRESNFLDPEFQQQFGKQRQQEILTDSRHTWEREYHEIMLNTELKRMAEQDAPEVLEWLEARIHVIRLAERSSVMAVPSAPAAPPRKKMNAEEVRALILRKDEIHAEDKIQRTKLKAQKILKARAELAQLDLEEDERQRLEAELIESILEEGEEGKNHGTTL